MMSNMNTHTYNPNVWWECALAYWVKAHNPEVELKPDKDYNEVFVWNKENFKNEDGTYPEVVNYMFADDKSIEYQSFECGVELTEFDPSTPGGWGFWSAVFNTEDLKKVALESQDGVAYGNWDALRQVMNMGQISFMTKFNLATDAYRRIHNQQDKKAINFVLGSVFYELAKEAVEKEDSENE